MSDPFIVEANGNASSQASSITATPVAGDYVIYAAVSMRAIPRGITGVTGMGATWTLLASTGANRVAWYLGTGANAAGTVTATFDGGTPTVGSMVWLLRGFTSAPAAVAYLTEAGAAGVLAGPVAPAADEQIVLEVGRASLNPVDLTALTPAAGWTIDMTPSTSMRSARRVPTETTPTNHQVTLTYPAASALSCVGTLVLGTAAPPAPDAPLDLIQTVATMNAVTLEWSPPTTGGPVTSYQYRWDGWGAWNDIGNVLTHSADYFLPGESFLFEVRSAGPGGTSAPASIWATSLPEPAFAGIRLEVGEEGEVVDLLGDSYSLTIRRGNSTRGVTDTLEAGTLTGVIRGPAANPLTVAQVRPGAPVEVLAGVDRGGAEVEWETIYTATLDRARLVYEGGTDKADPDAYRVTISATDVVPALAGHPSETAISGTLAERVDHVLAGTGLAYVVTDPDPGGGATPALATNERTAGGNLRLAVDTAHAVAYVDRHNVIQVLSDHSRPRIPEATAADLIATDDPEAPASALHYYAVSPALDTDAVVNVLEVETVATGGTTSATYIDTTSRDEWGPHPGKVTVNDGVPETHADLWLASRRDPELRPEAISLNVGERPAHLEAAVAVEPYTTVSVERAGVLPAPVKMAVRDIEHHITADRRTGIKWLLHLGLRPVEVLATRWDDVPPALTWDDLDPAMTWDAAVRWHPYL